MTVRAPSWMWGAGATCFTLAAAAHVWAHHIEIHRYTLREYTLHISPPGTPSLRLLHISDAHLLPDQHRKVAFLRELAQLEPDVVINTGDNLASAAAVPVLLDALEPLLKRPGAFVMGSNDMFAPSPKSPLRYLRKDPRPSHIRDPHRRPTLPVDQLAEGLSRYGWRDLTNRRDCLHVQGTAIDLVGVDDPHLDRDRFPAPNARSTSQLRLGVVHAPYQRVLNQLVTDGADLILAGHTHGGQLGIPGIGAIVTNCDLPRSQAKGVSTWRGTAMHVSAGFGASPYANMRFATPPEASLITVLPRRA